MAALNSTVPHCGMRTPGMRTLRATLPHTPNASKAPASTKATLATMVKRGLWAR